MAPFSNCHRSVRLPGAGRRRFGVECEFFFRQERAMIESESYMSWVDRLVLNPAFLLICSSFSRKLMAIRCLFAHQQAQPSRTYVPNKTGKYLHDTWINKTCRMYDMESSFLPIFQLWNVLNKYGDESLLEKNHNRKPGVPPSHYFCKNNLRTVDSRFLKVWLDSHEDMISSILDFLKGVFVDCEWLIISHVLQDWLLKQVSP